MGAPGSTHYLRAGSIADANRVKFLLQLDAIDTTDPHRWTIDGQPLTAAQLDMAHEATLADAETAAELLRLTGDQRKPTGVAGEMGGYPVGITDDERPEPAA